MRPLAAALPLLLLLGRGAGADDVEERVRALIESHRPDEGRMLRDLAFTPVPSVEGPLAFEMTYDKYWYVVRRFVRFVPNESDVAVLMLTLITVPPDGEPGSWAAVQCGVQTASLPHADYSDLLRALRLACGARLDERSGPVPRTGQKPKRWHMGDLRIRVGDVFEGKGDLPPEAWEEKGLIGSSIDEHAKAFLCECLLSGVLDALRYETPKAPPPEILAAFRSDLRSTDGWRRDLRAAFLGWLGSPGDIEALKAIEAPTPVVERAILQLGLLDNASRSEEGLARLLDLANDADPGLCGWARATLGERFKSAYLDRLSKDYRAAADWEARYAILKLSERVDRTDMTLCREALKDRSAWIRAMAAGRLGDSAALLALARDKSLRTKQDFVGRGLAMSYLGGLDAAPPEVGPALLRIACDVTDDVEARKDAAETLGRIGYRAAIPQLVAMLEARPPRKPVYLRDDPPSAFWYEHADDMRFGAARALAFLRATEGIAALMAILKRGLDADEMSEGDLASVAGEALARIGDPAALPLLQRALEEAAGDPEAETITDAPPRDRRKDWEPRVRLLKAIEAKDAKAILETACLGQPVDISGTFGGCDRYWIDLLAEIASAHEIRALLAAPREGRDAERARLLEAALARTATR